MYVNAYVCVFEAHVCAIRGAFIHDDQAELFQFQWHGEQKLPLCPFVWVRLTPPAPL